LDRVQQFDGISPAFYIKAPIGDW